MYCWTWGWAPPDLSKRNLSHSSVSGHCHFQPEHPHTQKRFICTWNVVLTRPIYKFAASHFWPAADKTSACPTPPQSPCKWKSKAVGSDLPVFPAVQVGDLVYIASDSSKTRAHHRYLVLSVDGLCCNIRKFTCSQLRSTSFHVKLTECYRVPDQTASMPHLAHKCCSADDSFSIDEELVPTTPSPSSQPQPPSPVPTELSEPPHQNK